MRLLLTGLILLMPVPLGSCGDEQSRPPTMGGHSHNEPRQAPSGPLPLGNGDRIVLVGNAFAERLSRAGTFETLLQAANPDLDLLVRSLAWPGDTPSLQPRPLDFGTMEQHLLEQKADIVVACFGMNESFDGPSGIDPFKESLRDFIASVRDLQPGGDEPEIVLVSPVAHESLGGDLPDGQRHNRDLADYTEAIRAVAHEQGTRFVDLYSPTGASIANPTTPPITINGIHLNDAGNRLAAAYMMQALFGSQPEADWASLEPLRTAVVDKNVQFFHRYRPINSYYVMGGRRNPFGVVNFPAEMEKLDAMVRVRDGRIHDLASGRVPRPIDDTHAGPLDEIETNYAGPEIVYRDPADTAAGFTLPEGFEARCFASEQDFPELANPVALSFDERGRLWVLAIPTYPQYLPGVEPADKLLVLEDLDGDGRADTCDVFADDLHVPTGFELGDGGVYVASQPNLMFLRDTDGDGRADARETVLHGFGTEDSHHAISAFEWGPGGGLYFQEGTFHHSQVETPHGPTRVKDGAVFRYEPRTGKLRVHVSYAFANPWGHVFDGWGQDYVADASGGANYFGAHIASRMSYDRKHRGVPSFDNKGIRPTGGCEVVSSEHLGEAMQGDYLLTNVITLRGIRQHDLLDEGSGVIGRHQQDLLVPDDPSFRPCDIQVGPDGALWFVDWYNPLIGHMQHSLRDPNRDHDHGRVWRIVRTGAPLTDVVDVSTMSPSELMDVLGHPERRTRDRARIALRSRPTDDVLEAVEAWRTRDDADEHDQLESLWVLQNHDVVDEAQLRRVLTSDDWRARAAAVRVLSAWADRIPDRVELLRAAAVDPAPRVRLEAVVAASWLDDLDGAEIALEASKHPTDAAIDHALGQTIIELAPHWTKALQRGWPYADANSDAIDDLLVTVSTPELVRMQPLPAVERSMLRRSDAPIGRRRDALDAVADDRSMQPAEAWLLEVRRDDERTSGDSSEPGLLLAAMTTEELSSLELEPVMEQARLETTRRAVLAAMMISGNESDPAGRDSDEQSVLRWLESIQLLPEGGLRDDANESVGALVVDPLAWQRSRNEAEAVSGRYIRIDLPGTNPLTLAEVVVESRGRNIAPSGTATQSSEAWGGLPQLAIDGDASPSFGSGSQSHTAEGATDPWWEVDLGAEHPIDTIRIHNRQDDPYWNRLDGYTITILDGDRGTAWQRTRQPAIRSMMEHPLNDDPTHRIRAMAIETLADGGAIPWSEELAETIEAAVRPIPIEEQSDPVLVAAMAIGERDPRIGSRLATMRVPVVELSAAPYRMDYDLEEFTVDAGAPVRLVLTNPDDKPHNLVIGTPGSLREIGRKATLLGTTSQAKQRHYVPKMRQVLHWIPVVEPHSSAELVFTAPEEPGDYVYVCTYPGHWTTMNGIMKVRRPKP